MAVVNFSMEDMQTLWENGGQSAYFASGDSSAQAKAPAARPGQVFVKDPTVKGGGFWRKTGQNIMGAGKGALNLGDKALKGTAGLGSKAVNAAGEGVVMGGMQVRRLGRTIAANPRTAGAVILGGTALGVGGGAYAMSRRNEN
jgi:hypothetical protein